MLGKRRALGEQRRRGRRHVAAAERADQRDPRVVGAREQSQAVASAELAYDVATQRYRAGLATYLTVLSAETNVLAQRRLGVDIRARTLDTQMLLVRALGGGYVAPGSVS